MNCAKSSDRLVEEMLSHMKPPVPIVDHQPDSKVSDFYADRSVFITGATGFIGKALVEKLIRSCDKIKRIYILIREKRGKSIHERLSDLIRSQYFDRIREMNNGSNRLLEDKLYAIKGDITLAKFGISPKDMRLLSDDCTIVFNSAATIRFVEPIDVAVRNNIYSVGQLIEFCDELEHLEALVHLSTAYSNCHKRDTIYEIFYEPPMGGEQIQASVKKLSEIQSQIHVCPEEEIEEDPLIDWRETQFGATKRSACVAQRFYPDVVNFATSSNSTGGPRGENGLVASASSASLMLTEELSTNNTGKCANHKTATGGQSGAGAEQKDNTAAYDLLAEFTRIALRMSNRPNTYTFTKAISESYLLDKARLRPDRYLNDTVPVAIVRPSIVGGAWHEPFVGLVDNYNGPTGAILSLYTGALQAMPGRGENVADLVPVDMVVNMVICAGWFLADQNMKASRAKKMSKCPVESDNGMYLFNLVSGHRNPALWRYFTEYIAELANKYPSKFLTRLPSSYFIRAGKCYELYDALNHKLPAYLIDLVRSKLLGQRCEGRSSALLGYSRIRQMTEMLTPFTSNQWRLCDSNVKSLMDCLEPADKQLFPFDVASISWPDYLRSYIIGSRIYTMRDAPKNVPAARRQLELRKHLNSLLTSCFCLLIYFLFVRGGQLERTLLSWLF